MAIALAVVGAAAVGALTASAVRDDESESGSEPVRVEFDDRPPTPPARPGQGRPPDDRRPAVARPRIRSKPIPFGSTRKSEMRAYARRHYGIDGNRLAHPRVIVEHYTVTETLEATFNTFAADVADPELNELPGVCAHFVIDRDGGIYQLVPLELMCRHTVGLNYTAIGIEHVGSSDGEVLGNRDQLGASLALTRWLKCRYGIRTRDVIGHAESLSSPYHRERVARLRTQTHGDFSKSSMNGYRKRLGDC